MLTRNFNNLVGTVLQSSDSYVGLLPFTDVYGMQYFYAPQFSKFPYSRATAFTTSWSAEGISVGSGNSPDREVRRLLDSTITSGISGSVSRRSPSVDGPSRVEYLVTVTNTSSSQKVITEIGYKQTVAGFSVPNVAFSSSAGNYVALMDRTLIDPAITLDPGEATVIRYVLETEEPQRTVNGVKIVSWQFGSDSDVADMIDAARNGTIDLQSDGGWAEGDMRPVTIGAFSALGNSNAEQTVDLTITSFDEYNECGNLMQVDFAESLATGMKMNSSADASDGYAASGMKSDVLPALYAALPQWLKDRLLEFDVLSNKGASTSVIETVTGNKLALRSAAELSSALSQTDGTYLPWYNRADKMRQKRRGRTGSNDYWWTRTAYNGTSFTYMGTTGSTSYGSANNAYGIAPFMCL